MCRWFVVLRARSYARAAGRSPRTDLIYELTGPTPEALRELQADEQVKAVAKARKLALSVFVDDLLPLCDSAQPICGVHRPAAMS